MKNFIALLFFFSFSCAYAQHSHHPMIGTEDARSSTTSNYADMRHRAIKALSSKQMEDLRAGKGMSLALAAELNGYPGPLHVLEFAEQLQLSEMQRTKVQKLAAEMKKEAAALGEQLIAAEARLDQLFRDKTATVSTIDDAVSTSAAIQGKLRAAHLRYHLEMMNLLKPEQVRQYNILRGYQQMDIGSSFAR